MCIIKGARERLSLWGGNCGWLTMSMRICSGDGGVLVVLLLGCVVVVGSLL